MLAGEVCDMDGDSLACDVVFLFTGKLWRFILKKIIALLSLLAVLAMMPNCKQTNADPVDVSFTGMWTATGDDGIVGRASQYDGRIAQSEDSLNNNWNSCTQWIGAGVIPLPSGQTETYTFTLSVETGQTYYLAIKTADEKPNWSIISNILAKYIPDNIAPAAIIDLSF